VGIGEIAHQKYHSNRISPFSFSVYLYPFIYLANLSPYFIEYLRSAKAMLIHRLQIPVPGHQDVEATE